MRQSSAMRIRLVLPVLGLFGAALIPIASTAVATEPAVTPATVKVFVMPVTASGEATAGFTVKKMTDKFPIYCNYKDPSRGAVSPDIETCSPAAAYALACWNSAAAHHVLCTQDPSTHKLVQFRRIGKFAKTDLARPRDRAPLVIVLRDGTHCKMRIGGAMGPVPHHPNLYGAYFCDRHDAAWVYAKGSHEDPHNGIDESGDAWRIRTGYKHIVWRYIATAYFVGTAA